jgi:hypothetical protein
MSILGRYRIHLAQRATGVSRLGWYWVSAREGAPWGLATAALTVLASFTPEPNRFLAMVVAFIPGFVGFVASQFYMLIVHLNDLRDRWGVRD